jgi:hypothetical protein
MMLISDEMRALGWYGTMEGYAARDLGELLGWSLREVSNGFGLESWQMRALDMRSPGGGLQIRLGVISYKALRKLCGWRFYGPDGGSGWLTFGAHLDVFQVAVRVWTDGGEASYLS